MAGYYPRVLYSTYTKSTSIKVFGETIKVDFTSPKDFFVAETDEIDLPEDLDPGDAKEEIFAALIEALTKAYKLPKEEYVFFLDPYNEYMVSGIRKEYVPLKVLENPSGWWPSHTANEWKLNPN
ncbi:hypothetical protein CrV_gp092 [Cylindrospermopsis raciborskii virus RM-2018a]|jgi:hypothetical protein|nr:hypothetical protein CrV_gp092 [Cylindrospermopsis raciborskii virus RM-2018a]WHL30664.1 hypothetical protein CrLKS4_g98 [Cylindrospermopsis phage Cr-LKS4]